MRAGGETSENFLVYNTCICVFIDSACSTIHCVLILFTLLLAPPCDLSAVTTDMGYSQDWGVGFGLHSDWGGPVLDHFVTMLATLLLPIK